MHYEETIRKKVDPTRIYKHASPSLRNRLTSVFHGRPIAVWGSRDTPSNRSRFERMSPGDEILIVEGNSIRLLGRIAATTVSPQLSTELWRNLKAGSTDRWDLIYFIANPVEIELPFSEFCSLFGYEQNYQLRGFASIATDRLERFYSRYDDLYSILIQIKRGQPVYEKSAPERLGDSAGKIRDEEVSVEREDIDAFLSNGALSDHVKMQWKLIGLGLKTGSKVWIPAGDQKKIREEFDFQDFETDFAAGLDTQTRYVENIDVVWKEEFRIDAAFEIENSTAIYSGLLRFADLSIVAPNSIYPLFIVAPRAKRNRLIEQLRRPTFRKMHMDRKVRYLSYEAVDEIDGFFQDSSYGLNVGVITGKAEEIRID